MILKTYKFLSNLFFLPILLFFFFRLILSKENLRSINEKFGIYKKQRPRSKLIWINAVSIGESLSVLPIIKKLEKIYPEFKILLTTSTITSAKILTNRINKNTIHQFCPIDSNFTVKKFLNYWEPNIAIFIESEFWPNLISEISKKKIPIFLLNARISKKSFYRWQVFPKFSKYLFSKFDQVIAQDESSKERLISLGFKNVKNLGNLKFLSEKLPCNFKKLSSLESKVKKRFILLIASSHKNEEEKILSIFFQIKNKIPEILLIILPRHINRTKEIQRILIKRNIKFKIRSQNEQIKNDTDCYLADTFGELGLFYNIADIIFVGGTLVPHGGQNPIEASNFNCAVIFGPHMHNFSEISNLLIIKNAAIQVNSLTELDEKVYTLYKKSNLRNLLAKNLKLVCLNEKNKTRNIWVELKKYFKNKL
ncbi:MAG: 3-deoxy-D-manno-octulosonic acid transferase [Rickettsiales bacterium]|nr:3-deoxy-D-manno-octulosonic acid transferase [Rickettsiales bacterium]